VTPKTLGELEGWVQPIGDKRDERLHRLIGMLESEDSIE
jgi:hypothetical protein